MNSIDGNENIANEHGLSQTSDNTDISLNEKELSHNSNLELNHTSDQQIVPNSNELVISTNNVTNRKRKRITEERDMKRAKIDTDSDGTGDEKTACDSSSNEEDYSLIISNVPKMWSHKQCKEYFETECGSVDDIKLLTQEKDDELSLKLTFSSLTACLKAFKCLKDKTVEGEVLGVRLEELEGSETSDTTQILPDQNSRQPHLNAWEVDPKGLYGLKPSFLKSLNITPPIEKWVIVHNFRCDKSELRDVMELAGHVLLCNVFNVSSKYAKVMYSHPLEAVQAISMLNGQKFYGQSLKVTMDAPVSDYSIVLPKGLANIGLGLGVNGKPLWNIVKHYHRYLKQQVSELNTTMFGELADDDATEPKDLDPHNNSVDNEDLRTNIRVVNIEEMMDPGTVVENANSPKAVSKPCSPAPTHAIRPAIRPSNHNTNRQTDMPRPVGVSNNLRPQPASVFSNRGPVPNPNVFPPRPVFPQNCVPGPRFGPGPIVRPLGATAGPMLFHSPSPVARIPGPQMFPRNDSCSIQMTNLPPSTTFPFLCGKLSQYGQVVSLQFTTPGCVVAKFALPAQAHACHQAFNGLNVEGHVIGVTFI